MAPMQQIEHAVGEHDRPRQLGTRAASSARVAILLSNCGAAVFVFIGQSIGKNEVA